LVGIYPGLAKAARDATAGRLQERALTIVADSRNRRLTALSASDFEGLGAAVRASLAGLFGFLRHVDVPLPEEPIGIGARWRTITMERQHDVDLRNTTDYELLSLDGERLVIGLRMVQEPLQDEYHPEGAPDDVRISLEDFESEIRGEVHLDLGYLTPTSARLKSNLRTSTQALANDEPVKMLQVTRMELTLEDPGRAASR
jgi:hypothetical protein